MIQIEIKIQPKATLSKIEQDIEKCCASLGLRMTLKGTLKKYPGSVHWHYKRGSQKGTLEITLWPKAHRLWFSIQAGRKGKWIAPAISKLKIELQKRIM